VADLSLIGVPADFELDDLLPSADADFPFASYQSKSEWKGNALRYTRRFGIKELSVPVDKLEQLKNASSPRTRTKYRHAEARVPTLRVVLDATLFDHDLHLLQ
jgi:hypothetical protein